MERRLLWVAVGMGLMCIVASLLGTSATANGCDPGACAGQGLCFASCDCKPSPTGIVCSEQCKECEAEATPGGTAVPGTPQPTLAPTPAPTVPAHWAVEQACLPDGCAPGESRPAKIFHLFGGGTVVQYIGDCCDAPCNCPEPGERQPCTPGSSVTSCAEWGASVRGTLPPWPANREPYPRALVTLPVRVWVSDALGNPSRQLPGAEFWGDPVSPPTSDCSCRDDDSCRRDESDHGPICEYRLGLRADPGNMPPTWNIEECGGGTGWQIACDGWQKSSWGKPELGVGLSPDCPRLPAYAATARVPYWWSLGRRWEEWEIVDQDCECECHGGAERPPGVEGCSMSGCDGADVHTELHCENRYGWVEEGPNWILLDLTHYGHPTPYMDNPFVYQIARPPCEVSPPVGALYIPCIEVQAPIQKWP